MAGILPACGDGKVVLTTGFGTDELFRIGNERGTGTEFLLYLTNIANQYESVYGEELWSMPVNEQATMLDNCKELALAQLSRLKAMYLLAKEHEVTLTEEEEAAAVAAAQKYLTSLSDTEKEALGITKGEVVEELYCQKLLADKLYAYLIRDVNPEISDDEARTITVQHILLKTYALDGTGKKIEYTDTAKLDAYKTACEVLEKAQAGEDFDELIRHYSEDDKATYSFGKGEMDATFEKAAFNLGNGEISDIVETEYGYHIIKCISTFDKEETDSNKIKIVEQRKEEVFGQEYDAFVATLTRKLNEDLWEEVRFIHDDNVVTADFFEVYNDYFE